MTDAKLPAENRSVCLTDDQWCDIFVRIDKDGDLLVEYGGDALYIGAPQATQLRDWLNKVLP